MRIWTVHPKYLDAKGLTALWREGLLARAVLRGMTTGYANHPQLIRLRAHADPLAAMDVYLRAVLVESRDRGYHFDATKIDETVQAAPIEETSGQLAYEWSHLMKKLELRDRERWSVLRHTKNPDCHPFFTLVPGDIRPWEKIS